MPSLRDWIFIIGVVLLTLILLAYALPDERDKYEKEGAAKKRAQSAHSAYGVGLIVLLALVTIPDFRRGLVTNLGVPELWSWPLALIGLMLVLAASVATFGGGQWWFARLVIFLGSFAAYMGAAFGSAGWQRLITPAALGGELSG